MDETATPKLRLDVPTCGLMARLWRDWARPHLGRMLCGFALMAVVAAAAGAYPVLIGQAVDRLGERNLTALLVLPPAIVIIAAIKGGASYGQSVITMSVAFRIIAEMQKAMFAHLMHADIAMFQNTATGKLLSRFTNDTNMLRDAISKSMTSMVMDMLIGAVMLGIMFWRDWLLALAVVLLLPLAARPVIRIGRRLRRVSGNTQVEFGELTSQVGEALSGIRLIKSYRLEDRALGRASGTFENIYGLVMKLVKGRSRTYPILETLSGLAVALVLFYGGLRIIYGSATLGDFITFLTALGMALRPLRSLGNLNAALQEGLAAAQRIFELLDSKPAIVDKPEATALVVTVGAIRLEDVRFAYESDKSALDGITMDIPAGKTVALVGPSGAGKSTVFNLIPRFFDVGDGRITIDGLDVRDVTMDSLRAQIGMVSQDVILFNDTVRANIALGRPDADDAAIAAAAQAAAAADFIAALPHGYDTVVGERGLKLSGGERQRIAIARAMLKDSPILLLDEATSALDTESERLVQAALDRLTKGRTTLVIAHRLSTVVGADLIYVMEHGRIAERGTHGELLTRGGLYARLCRLQFRHDLAVQDDAPATVRAG